jgi:hypothetical protein
MTFQSCIGFFFPSFYRDGILVLPSWQGNDFITLFIASPMLLLSIILYSKGSIRAKYVLFALIFYVFYNYSYYVFGTLINQFFLIYILLFLLSGLNLIRIISYFDKKIILKEFGQSPLYKIISVFLMMFSLLIVFMWLSLWLKFMITGSIPKLFGMEEGYRLVAAMDLSIQVPCLAISSVLLWKNNPVGYLLGTMTLIANSLYMLVLMAYSPFASRSGISNAWNIFPLWLILFIGCFLSSIILLENIKTRKTGK